MLKQLQKLDVRRKILQQHPTLSKTLYRCINQLELCGKTKVEGAGRLQSSRASSGLAIDSFTTPVEKNTPNNPIEPVRKKNIRLSQDPEWNDCL